MNVLFAIGTKFKEIIIKNLRVQNVFKGKMELMTQLMEGKTKNIPLLYGQGCVTNLFKQQLKDRVSTCDLKNSL